MNLISLDRIGYYTILAAKRVDRLLRQPFKKAVIGPGLLAGVVLLSAPARAGQLFVTNYGDGTATTGKIGLYTTSGATLNASFITGLHGPWGIAVSGSDLFVVNYATGTIGKYNTSGATVNAALVTGLHQPTGVAVSGSNLFVVNNEGGTIGEYNAVTGATVNPSLISSLASPIGIAISGSNMFVLTQFGGIGEYTTTGATVNANLIGVSGGEGIAISGPFLFATHINSPGNDLMGEYTTSGVTVSDPFISGLSNPQAIAVMGTNLFVTNSSDRIREYTTSGVLVNASLISGLNSPQGLAVVADVPEPASLGLLGCGAMGLLLRRRRRVLGSSRRQHQWH